MNCISIVAAFSFTSKIDISSNSILRGNASLGASDEDTILRPKTSSIIDEPENPNIPIIITNAATTPPTIILGFTEVSLRLHILNVEGKIDNSLNVETKNAYSDKTKLNYQSACYSNLGHMDTQLPTFIKGLQWTFKINE